MSSIAEECFQKRWQRSENAKHKYLRYMRFSLAGIVLQARAFVGFYNQIIVMP